MQYRTLGRTGLEVSVVGFGGIPIKDVDRQSAVAIVNRAVDLGINHIHTSPTYGDSASKVGEAIEGRRDDCILNVKIFGAKRSQTESQLRQAFEDLRTDHLDIVQFRITEGKFGQGMGDQGGLQVLKRAQDEGTVDHIGITDHHPEFLASAIESGEFSNLVVPFNYVYDGARERLIPRAKEMDVGIVAMKTLGKGALTNVPQALNYVWGHGVPTAIVGVSSLEEVEEDASIGEEIEPLTREQLKELDSRAERLRAQYEVSNGALLPKG